MSATRIFIYSAFITFVVIAALTVFMVVDVYGQEVNKTYQLVERAINVVESDIYNRTGSHVDIDDGNNTQQELEIMKKYMQLDDNIIKQTRDSINQYNENH